MNIALPMRVMPWLYGIFVSAWLIAVLALMQADVWDETRFLLFASTSTENPFFTALALWLQPLENIYRPLPISVAFLIAQLLSFDWAWPVLRLVNAGLLLGSAACLVSTLRAWQVGNRWQHLQVFCLLLASGSAVITAGWYANIFDAMALALLMLGIWFSSRQSIVLPVLCFSLAFFCKETSLLIFPVLIALRFAQKLKPMQFNWIFGLSVLTAIAYLALRHYFVPIGSQQDIHHLDLASVGSTLYYWLSTLWWQHTQGGWPVFGLGLMCSACVLVTIKGWLARLLVVVLWLSASILYLSMLIPYDTLLSHLNFIGRLYLIPFVFTLLLLALWAKPIVFKVLLIPVFSGAVVTYYTHYHFQLIYQHIYLLAAQQASASTPLYIHYPATPFHDPRRHFYIGDYPNAAWRLTPQGQLQALPTDTL